MIARRDLLGGAMLGGWLGSRPAGAAEPGAPQSRDGVDVSGIVDRLERLRQTIEAQAHFTSIEPVRDRQKEHLKLQGKLPDFIEVGVDVWFDVYDWHVRNLLTPTFGRDAAGRYTITLMETVLIMRPDFPQARYIGPPYDSR
jgi:hypothetical protein